MSNLFTLDIEELSIEMQLLLALIRVENIEDVAAIPEKLFEQSDWNSFIELARHHRVYPYLYNKLKGVTEDRIPSIVIRIFLAEYRRNTFLMLHLSGEMEIVEKALSENSIRALYLKGPVLAQDLYGNLSLRTSCDLDLLIPISELNRAEALLITLGYTKDDYIHTVLNDWKWRHHHITFFHPEKGVKVEIHWRLNPAPSKQPNFEELWKRRRTSSLSKQPIYYLGREDLFLFLVSHGARHGWSRLRWLLDIKQLIVQELDADFLTSLLRKHSYLHIGGQALVLVSGLFKVPIPHELFSIMNTRRAERLGYEAMFYLKRIVSLHSNPIPDDVDRYHKRHMFTLLTKRQKLQFVLSFLFPYPEDAETLPLPKALHVLYVPLRPFLWVWRKWVGGQQ